MNAPSQSHMKLAIILVLSVSCLLLIAAISFRLIAAVPGMTIQGTGEGLSKAIQSVLGVFRDSKITINDKIFVQQQEPVLELATSQFTFDNEHEMTSAWLGSEKTVKVSGHFIAKLGFNLKKYCSITIDEGDKTILVSLAPPELLSLEIDQQEFKNENGWYNKLNDDDLNKVVAEAKQYVRQIAASPHNLKIAADSGKDQIVKLLSGSGYRVTVEIGNSAEGAKY